MGGIMIEAVKLNVMALVDSAGFDAERLTQGVTLADYGISLQDLTELKRLFEHATTFGSLIQVPERLATKLPALRKLSGATSQDLFVSEALKRLGPLVRQAEFLATQYDAVVMNPPYLGSMTMNALVKRSTKDYFPAAKSDLFACFIDRGCMLANGMGHNAMVTMQSWMFLSSFQKMRERILPQKTISTMAHLGARAFSSISGEVVQTTAFVLWNRSTRDYKPAFLRLLDGGEESKRRALATGENRFDRVTQDAFGQIPGSPLAYWATDAVRLAFSDYPNVSTIAETKAGLTTGDNTIFQRAWTELNVSRVFFSHFSRAGEAISVPMVSV